MSVERRREVGEQSARIVGDEPGNGKVELGGTLAVVVPARGHDEDIVSEPAPTHGAEEAQEKVEP